MKLRDLLRLTTTLVSATALGLLVQHTAAQGAQIARATDPGPLSPLAMHIGGRVLTPGRAANHPEDAANYVYQWPGIYFEAAFQGTEAYFRMGEGKQIVHVILDQQAPTVLIKPEPGLYRISGLADGPHTVRIELVTESQAAPDSFGGFALPPSSSPRPAPRQARQIEFIGDSHTVGYGNTSPKHECSADEIWATTDTSQAFGPLTAKHYHADYQVNAISGHGIVRNYNGSPGDPVPVAYPYVLLNRTGRKNFYADSSWNPQIFVLALGANDFSTPLNPGEKWKTRDDLHSDYEATYVRFLQGLHARYPHAYFILWATEGANGEIQSEVQKVIALLKASGDTGIAFIPVNGLSMSGCDWHPSVADDSVISSKLIHFIDQHPELWQGK